jgi:hypothetical protein
MSSEAGLLYSAWRGIVNEGVGELLWEDAEFLLFREASSRPMVDAAFDLTSDEGG